MNNRKQTIAGLVRERLPDIENKLEMGFRQETIIEEFAQQGFIVSLGNFRTELYRARKWRSEKHGKSSPKPTQNRPQPIRQGTGITEPEKTAQKCDIAQRLNSITHEELFGEVKK